MADAVVPAASTPAKAAKPSGGRSTARKVGLIGAIVGVAAAGIAAGVAAERAWVRRSRAGVEDPYADEPFGRLPFDESLTVTTADGVDLYVEIVEPADGVTLDFNDADPEPTVIFVHGFCLDMGTFHFQRRLLDGGEYRMVLYDQPGHGKSGRLSDGEYDLPALGEALRDVIRETTTPDSDIVLVGHSMGGMAIMACAERYPEIFANRVVGVALISTSGGRVQGVKLGGLPELISRTSAPLLPVLSGASRMSGPMIDKARQASSDLAWLLTRRYGFGGKQPSPALVSYVERMNSGTTTETVARYLRTLSSHARYPALAAIADKPVLVIVGDKDPILPLKHSEEIVRHLPQAEMVVVPDSGHVVLLEHADAVNEALLAFLAKVMP
ncbi:pimeloyl-ACP methyl ester carboxylesterase [Allocatelliglobosispora scoriae]|uniref:Pimeloyl-ACP methyl ester carboxylesterase n=1 Tax=Allocatelliglobosispora scoriae TaxID=643052 RepID=A0A841BXY0_9ACTN|nr:alpha/beta hydrolase [Allocatelliglobosispora scoriae]MBB5871531.1 pimeloyl-ACP methyl ester carboxylesterase [Allocatelliglobosispora scoriae]